MDEQIFRLRGHHLDRFILYYQVNGSFDGFELLRKSMQSFWSHRPVKTKNGYKLVVETFYDEPTIDKTIEFFKNLSKNLDAKIQIINGNDDICKLCCNEDRCSSMEMNDKESLEKYGVKVGNILSVNDLISYILKIYS